MGYYDSYNPDLLKLIPPDAKTVLEIGCGEGALCEAYRRVNPTVEWNAVEMDEAAASKTEGIIDLISVVDLNHESFIPGVHHHYDCLVCGDVLEHLIDPLDLLRQCMDLLKPGAQVLACIPNVQHWTVIRDLLEGKWDYTDSGLLDRTHLRFFTLKSIREMFDQAGLQVHEIIGRDLFSEGLAKFLHEYPASFFGPNNILQMRAYQYLVRAIKPVAEIVWTQAGGAAFTGRHSEIPKLHIHAIEAEDCCARPRIREPFAMLKTIPGVKCTRSTRDGHNRVVPDLPTDASKILVRQRNTFIEVEHLRKFIADGWLIVQECDDYPLAYELGAARDWMVFRGCHAIQCSTEAIAEIVRQYNPNVMVFENQIAELPPLGEFDNGDIINIFCGWQNRNEDWKPILPSLNRVAADHPEIHFLVIHDHEFFDALNAPLKAFRPFCEYSEYRALLSGCDIALLPLEDTPFNRCKSDIKFLECAAEGVAVLASRDMHACRGNRLYRGMMDFYETPAEFEAYLSLLIEKPEKRLALAQNAYACVRDNRLLSQHYRKRYEWYQSLLSSKPNLDRQLLERVPELSGHLAPA